MEVGWALTSAHPGPALLQGGAPKNLCEILQMVKLGSGKIRAWCETTSYNKAVKARKKDLDDYLISLFC